MYNSITVAVDFDGTCVTNEYPNLGEDIGAAPILKKLVENEVRLILYTMRSGKTLQDAVDWFSKNGIILWGVNENPEQYLWTASPKVYADIYIDDAALGTPLISKDGKRPFVDWKSIAGILGLAELT